ncbi:MAG: hypothetical protein HQ515_21625 [Phycisphaeraceae bacterium]|nr:hypothetical protein [Phycisphaeraceae bacterium]
MITESLTAHVLHGVFLALTPSERWSAASSPLNTSFTAEQGLIVLAVLAQTASLAIVWWLVVKRKGLEHAHKQEMLRVSSTNEELRQKIDELSQQAETLTSEQMTSKEPAESEESIALLYEKSSGRSPGIN